MIDCFNMASAYRFGDALASQFRLRHRVFIQRTAYDVPSWNGMEFDQYDTPATTYLVWRDLDGEAKGVARLSPTTLPYMLKDVFPEMVTSIPLPNCPTIWEGTRFGVDQSLPADVRRRIVGELVAAYAECALFNGIEAIIGLMPTLIVRTVFEANGWPVQRLGGVHVIGRDKCIAGMLPVNEEILHRIRGRTGISQSIFFAEPMDLD